MSRLIYSKASVQKKLPSIFRQLAHKAGFTHVSVMKAIRTRFIEGDSR